MSNVCNNITVSSGNTDNLDVWADIIPNRISSSLRDLHDSLSVREVSLRDNAAAVVLSDEFYEMVFIRNAHIKKAQPGENVYYDSYRQAADCLADLGLSFANVVRTWIYITDIDNNYNSFNADRDIFYNEEGVFKKMVPASTAIGKPQKNGADMVLHILAVRSIRKDVVIQAAPSPLQCSAMDYKVSFSRAVEIQTPAYNRLIISGTASIDTHGKTVFEQDVKRQADQTVKVIEALLKSRAMTLKNLTRVLAYTKRDDDLAFGDGYIKFWMPDLENCSNVQADICRKNLLFEIEAEALLKL